MAKRYQSLIEEYCALHSVAVPPGFGRNSPSRYVIIRTDLAPPKLVATTWRKVADVVYYIERFLAPELGDSLSQSVRILDFQERRELVYAGGRRLRETATFSIRDEERFRALALASAQLIWTTTPDGLAEECSPSWSAFTGQTFVQCIGEGWLDAIHPDDRETVRKTWLDSAAEERLYEVEYRLRRPDGVYRWVAARAAPVFDVNGGIREWIGVATDITERKEAEQAQARLAAIVESSSDAIIAADLDGVITNWNQGAERLYGYTAREAVGQSVMTLIPPELSGEGESVMERLRRGERFEQFETVSRRKDGSDVAVSWTISPKAVIRSVYGT